MALSFPSLGGRGGALRYYFYRAAGLVGMFDRSRSIDPNAIQRFVFVCSGNICRSPYAEYRCMQRGFPAASFGTTAIDGALANDGAIQFASDRGADLLPHRSTALCSFRPLNGDLLLALEPRHLKVLDKQQYGKGVRTALLGGWAQPRAPFIPDPYAKGDRCFLHTFELIDNALEGLFRWRGLIGNEVKGEREREA